MSKPTRTFRKTGKNVTVSRDDLINAMMDKLQEYDALADDQRSKMPNPYSDPINITLADGKMIQIPRYVQNAAITRWRANILSPHTRMDRRKRYSGRDPYIMNRDLKGVKGDRDDFEYCDYGLMDRNLNSQLIGDIQRRRAVGQTSVPDERYGRGGSYGDLPRDFEIFDRRIERGVDDTTYLSDKNTPDRVNPVGYYDVYDPNYFKTQDNYDALIKERVRVKDRKSRRGETDMSCGGPAESSGAKVMRHVSPNESDINSEMTSGDINVVENYAPLDEEDEILMDDNRYVYNYDPYAVECKGCYLDDDRFDRNRFDRRSDRDRIERFDYDRYDRDRVDYDRYDRDGYDRDEYGRYRDRYEDDDWEDYEDDPVREGMIESMDSDCDNTYKYLFFILLIVIIIVVAYNYKRNNGNELGL